MLTIFIATLLTAAYIDKSLGFCKMPFSGDRIIVNHQRASKPRSMNFIRRFSTSTDDNYEEVLDDMIYSGDMLGFIRKKSKEVVNKDFLSFLENKKSNCHEEDEKQVVEEIIDLISEKLKQTDGLTDSGVVFENRLDKILFKAPNLRRGFIKENAVEMTDGFIDYVQKELKSNTDIDSKVVLASILQLIGQEKNVDLLGKNVEILKKADSSLGEQFESKSGLIESSSVTESKQLGSIGDRNEQILAALIFSKNDVLEDVLNNLHEINDEFVTFLQLKLEKSTDMEERPAFASLLNTINTVLERVREVEKEDSLLKTSSGDEVNIDEVKQRMQSIQMGQQDQNDKKKYGLVDPQENQKKNSNSPRYSEFSVKQEKKETFLQVLKRFQNLNSEYNLQAAVLDNYDLCDYEFMEMLKSEAEECQIEGALVEMEFYNDLLATINRVMVDKIGNAQERLEKILNCKTPHAMLSAVTLMTRRGEVDEALVLLIEANLQQAEQADASQAAEVLKKLLVRINEEKERKMPDEQKLLRALVRLDDSEKRKTLLYQAFKPSKTTNSEGQFVDSAPLISPPSFINMVRIFIQNFGNVDSFDIMGRSNTIIDEAQLVATDLYGEGMTPREQQKLMFAKQTISVWDLANYEEQAMMSGEEIPWGNDAFDGKNPEDVLGERVKRVGGIDGL